MQTEGDSEYDLLASIVLLLFSPYFWVSTIFLFNKIFDKIRINKNRKILNTDYYYKTVENETIKMKS